MRIFRTLIGSGLVMWSIGAPGMNEAIARAAAADESFEFTVEGGRRFDARIERPDPQAGMAPNGWAVMLIGGGSITDMDWTVSGKYTESDGHERQFTIDGEPTRDGAAIAREFLRRGYTMLRWTSIHKDDPRFLVNSALADYQTFERTVLDTLGAFRAFEEHHGFERGKIILVAHSLGAARAAALIRTETGISGLVSIAGSEIARLGYTGKGLDDEVKTDITAMDADQSGTASADEFNAWAAKYPEAALPKAGFTALDFDGDGVLHNWELGAGLAIAARAAKDVRLQRPSLKGDNPFLEDVLVDRKTPAIFISGSEDWLSRYAPVIKEHAAKNGLTRVIVKIMPGLNHQLAEQRGEMTGPMKPEAIKTVVAAAETIRIGFGLDPASTPPSDAQREK